MGRGTTVSFLQFRDLLTTVNPESEKKKKILLNTTGKSRRGFFFPSPVLYTLKGYPIYIRKYIRGHQEIITLDLPTALYRGKTRDIEEDQSLITYSLARNMQKKKKRKKKRNNTFKRERYECKRGKNRVWFLGRHSVRSIGN